MAHMAVPQWVSDIPRPDDDEVERIMDKLVPGVRRAIRANFRARVFYVPSPNAWNALRGLKPEHLQPDIAPIVPGDKTSPIGFAVSVQRDYVARLLFFNTGFCKLAEVVTEPESLLLLDRLKKPQRRILADAAAYNSCHNPFYLQAEYRDYPGLGTLQRMCPKIWESLPEVHRRIVGE